MLTGTVANVISPNRFGMELENGRRIVATMLGQIRMKFIRVLPGSKILVKFSPDDSSNGRISGRKQE
ncbi:MAG: translation initiation factor IF-1 [Verrucomicrobiales bacterium]|nr:translation initiation factor IF-1 [Verrucomicrobiales bacterium]